MKRFVLLVPLAGLLFNGGCYSLFASRGVKATDLSVVRVGATRASVERVLGDAIRSETVGDTRLSTYRYNLGRRAKDVDPEMAIKEGLFTMLYGPIFLIAAAVEYEKQRGEILVAYGPDERVRGIGRTQDEVERHMKGVEKRRTAVARAEQGDALAQFELARMRRGREGWRWLCLSANQGYAAAQVGMGDYYFSGGVWPASEYDLGDSAADHVRAWVWYSLAASKENELGSFKREWVTRLMALEEMVEAEGRLADWRPEKCAIESSNGE